MISLPAEQQKIYDVLVVQPRSGMSDADKRTLDRLIEIKDRLEREQQRQERKKQRQYEPFPDGFKEGISHFDDYPHLAKQFMKNHPLFYDLNKNFWIWNKEEFKWKMVDDTSVMNGIDDALTHPGFTTRSAVKNEVLEALRREGRRNIPKPANPNWVQFKGKVYDVLTGECFDATPEYFITNPIPWKVGDTEDTPTIDRLMREWVIGGEQDETWVETLHETCAYTMLSTQPLQKIFADTGKGANGKGCRKKLLQKFLGPGNYAETELKLLAELRFETSIIYKKLAVFMSELNEEGLENTIQLKKLSGEDEIRYEFKGKGSFSEPSYTTALIGTNTLPVPTDKSEGFFRRWIIIDFPNTFEVGRDVIGEIPDVEFENWARKLLRIARELLEKKRFTNEGSTAEKTSRYEQRSNPVKHFINEFYDENTDGRVEYKEFYDELQAWLPAHNHRQLTTKAVTALLKSIGLDTGRKDVKIIRGKDERGFDIEEWITKNFIFGLTHKPKGTISPTAKTLILEAVKASKPYPIPTHTLEAIFVKQGGNAENFKNTIKAMLQNGELTEPKSGEVMQK